MAKISLYFFKYLFRRLLHLPQSHFFFVCSDNSLQIQPEQSSTEEELVLHIKDIVNHPSYEQGTNADKGAHMKGPYAGADIAVYHLTEKSKHNAKEQMRKKKETLRPACLPKKEYSSKRGFFAGWLDQEPFYRAGTLNIRTYEKEYLFPRTVEVRQATKCTKKAKIVCMLSLSEAVYPKIYDQI